MMEIIDFNHQKAVRKEVNNTTLYFYLQNLNLDFIPKILQVGSEDVVYEYLEGLNLNEKLATNISVQQRIQYAKTLIKQLEILSRYNVIHKDIKPENIIVTNDDQVYLIDFDASRMYDGQKGRDTTLLGTREYASPEHYGYLETTYKSDMYSLGKVMLDLQLPASFNYIIEKCTQINPDDRYQDYHLLLKDFEFESTKYLKSINKAKVNEKDNSKNKTKPTYTFVSKDVSDQKNIFTKALKKVNYYNFDKSKVQRGAEIFFIIFYLMIVLNLKDQIKDINSLLSFAYTYFLFTFNSMVVFDLLRKLYQYFISHKLDSLEFFKSTLLWAFLLNLYIFAVVMGVYIIAAIIASIIFMLLA